MDEIKDELTKSREGVSKILTDFSDIVLDRFKNPYITAFTISWLAFNWKPIIYLILSKNTIEGKIKYITENYSDINYYLYFPLTSSIIFLFLVPYLNQLNEWFLRFSVKKRADYVRDQIVDKINRDTDIAIAENNKQRAIKFAREGEEHNDYVDQLNTVIKNLNDELNQERFNHIEEIKKLQGQNKDLLDEIIEVNKNYNDQLENVNRVLGDKDLLINNQKNEYQKLLKQNSDQQNSYEKLQQEVLENSGQTIDSKQNEIVGLKNLIKLYSFMDERRASVIKKYGKFVNTKILFSNGISIYEVFDDFGYIYYTQGDLSKRFDINIIKDYFESNQIQSQTIVDKDLKTIA